ncbi:MAG: methyltransferase [Clostridia bacterium]
MDRIATVCLKPGERIEDLQRNGLHILQNANAFCFGTDAVLLADFAQLRRHDRVLDMGTGTGILPLLLSQQEETALFYALEIQPDMADLAARSVHMNGLDKRITVLEADLRAAHERLGYQSMNAVVCNPPYGKRGGTIPSEQEGVCVAKHETNCGIDEIVAESAAVLKNLGRLSLVFPAQRMLELLDALRKRHMEPKRIRMVCAKLSRAPYLVLVEAVKNGKPFLSWQAPLVILNEDGSETEEIKRIYHRL